MTKEKVVSEKAVDKSSLSQFEKATLTLGAISILAYLVTIKSSLGISTSAFGNLVGVLGVYSALVVLTALVSLVMSKSTKKIKALLIMIILLCSFISFMELLGAAIINT